MKFIETNLNGVIIIEPIIFGDHRGSFIETYSGSKFKEAGINLNFLQDSQFYFASSGTLRGLHYQLNPKAQTKLVRCTNGAIYDVAVDIRTGSPTYGQWFGIVLSSENKKQLLIQKGFAHAFMTLTEDTEIQYKVDELYSPENDKGIIWNDPEIGIDWPRGITPILSEKDEKALLLKDAENNFTYHNNSREFCS